MDCGRYQATGDYRVTGLALTLARIEEARDRPDTPRKA
jgi:hypothetical protein